MCLDWPPGSDTKMRVGQEVLANKQPGGKLGGSLIVGRLLLYDTAKFGIYLRVCRCDRQVYFLTERSH